MIQSHRKTYIEASTVGLLRSIIGLPFEHPFDSIKSRIQAQINNNTHWTQTVRDIYREHGIRKGFYAGFIPSAARCLIKQVYRWPLMLFLPEFFSSVYPTSLTERYPSIKKVSTGLAIAAVDTFIMCPFERLKVCFQTKSGNLSFTQYMSQNKNNVVGSLFRGLTSLFYRQITAWVSFLYLDEKLKKVARKYQGIPDSEALNNATLLFLSVLVGTANVFIVMPFDMTKTLYQQHSGEFRNRKLIETMRVVYKNMGVSGFYSGWQPRMIQYMINAMFTVTALEKLEHKMKKAAV